MIGGIKQAVVLARAKEYCQRYKPQLIGVAGGWGSDITVQALAEVLAHYTTLRAGGVANSPMAVAASVLGVPDESLKWVTLLGKSRIQEIIHEEPKAILANIPSSRPGQIDAVASALPFTMVIIPNVHSTNLEYYNDKGAVAHELLALPASLSKKGTAVMNIDDPLLASYADNISGRVIGFGSTAAADVRIQRMHEAMAGGFAAEIHIGTRIVEGYFPHLFTSLQVYTVVAAVAALYAITNNAAAAANAAVALARFKPPAGYGSMHEKDKMYVIDDTFNATPESMHAGLHALSKRSGRKIAVLGDITELGGVSSTMHQAIGEDVSGVANMFVAVGKHMREAQSVALKSSDDVDAHHFEAAADAGKWMRQYLKPGDTMYVAGSREMGMDTIVARLLGSDN